MGNEPSVAASRSPIVESETTGNWLLATGNLRNPLPLKILPISLWESIFCGYFYVFSIIYGPKGGRGYTSIWVVAGRGGTTGKGWARPVPRPAALLVAEGGVLSKLPCFLFNIVLVYSKRPRPVIGVSGYQSDHKIPQNQSPECEENVARNAHPFQRPHGGRVEKFRRPRVPHAHVHRSPGLQQAHWQHAE